jgi:hypothetical protein
MIAVTITLILLCLTGDLVLCLTLYWWSGGLVIMEVHLVMSNFILVVWRSSDYGGRSCFV